MDDTFHHDVERAKSPKSGFSAPPGHDCVFVDREEFCRLLVSRQSLKRAVDRTTNLAYLIEDATGRHYAIKQDQLFRVG